MRRQGYGGLLASVCVSASDIKMRAVPHERQEWRE
jgi:hypothetical protein